ncbi:MAG: hypothetical protein QF570_13400 [Myxococcota bacterium]|jgi:uncharacterized coiled-coil DUF342 family protein|nr:hypothetical protein [Myxococcota bacterium]
MSDERDDLRNEVDQLRALRDELHVQLHLAGQDLRDQWDRLERGWHHVESRAKQIGDVSDDVAHEVRETLHVLADQLRGGYERIKSLL